MVRVHQLEFALMREYYTLHGNNYALIANLVRRRIVAVPQGIPENVVELWNGLLSPEQLRRRVREAIARRIGK